MLALVLQGFFYPEATVCGFMHAADSGISVTSNSYYTDPWLFNCKNDTNQNAIFVAVNRCALICAAALVQHNFAWHAHGDPAHAGVCWSLLVCHAR